MKLFTAMEEYTCGSSATYTLEELEVIEVNLNNEHRVLNSAVESYKDASTALKHLVKLEGIAPHNRGVHSVTMESINDQLGYPEGTVLSSEGVGDSIKNFAKKVWAKIVATWHAIRDWIRKLFGMAPIPSEESLKKTDDIIKEAVDKGPTIKTGPKPKKSRTPPPEPGADAPVRNEQLETDILNAITEEMKKVMVDVDKEVEEAAKVRDDELEALAKKKATYAEHEAEAYAIEKKHNDIIAAKVKKAKELAEQVIENVQEALKNNEAIAEFMEMDRVTKVSVARGYEHTQQRKHPKAYDIEMGIALSTVLKATDSSALWVTKPGHIERTYAADDIKEIMPFLNDPTNAVMTEERVVTTIEGSFDVGPRYDRKATIYYVHTHPGGRWDVDYIHTGEDHAQIVANHEWFKAATDRINMIMEKLTPEHFLEDDLAIKLAENLSADLKTVGLRKAALMKRMDKNNKLVRALMEDTNEATYRYLQDHYIASDTDNRNIKG